MTAPPRIVRARCARVPGWPPALRVSTASLIAVTLLSVGCSSIMAQARRDSRLREGLDEHRFRLPLSKVWPVAMRVVVDAHFELVGQDRTVVGEPEQNLWKQVTGGGFQTRRSGEHGLVLESREDASRLRIRVEGVDGGDGTCRVTFTAIQETSETSGQERSRDLDLELELVRRLEPDEAARVSRVADAASRR
jgi:hypothetical protein